MSDFNDVISLIRHTPDEALLEDLLVGLTTDKERHELAQRLEIVKRLRAGEPQSKIANDLGVGVATVTRGSKELSQGRFKILDQLVE
jgi:TrpR family transcriptional regulator, trp operon repressor